MYANRRSAPHVSQYEPLRACNTKALKGGKTALSKSRMDHKLRTGAA
jgi:hypothetical protein